jgi:type VI secretion system protein ImpB
MPGQNSPKINQRVKVSILPSSDAKESVELDYRLMVAGDFSRKELGSQGMLKDRRIRTIARKGDFSKVLADYNPKLKLTVPNRLSDDPEAQMEVNLDIKDMKDFHPDEIVKQVDPLKDLLATRELLKMLKMEVFKDFQIKKGMEDVLKGGSGSIDALMAKLAGEAHTQDKK